MVSTRQMSNGAGGSSSSNEGGALVHGEQCSYGRITRHSAAGGSSPQQSSSCHVNTSKTHVVPLPPKGFTTNILDLPVLVLEKIFNYVGYKTVSQLRLVNRQFNTVCSSVLNSTFQRLQNQMLHRFQDIKGKMPRRESARRSHPLACESDIIETLHMRLSLLQMTFGKHIERKHCCFFPGEILDEVYSILAYLKTTTKLARPFKVTDELYDLTTMAMEYFKEHIEPNLPEIAYFGTDFFDITNPFSPGESSKSYMCVDSPPPGDSGDANETVRRSRSNCVEESLTPSPPPQSNMVLRKRIHRIKQGMKKYNDQLSALKSDLKTCKRKTALQQKQIAEQQKQIAEQQKQTMEYASRLDDYDKKNEETSRKFQTLLQELNKCKTELQYWRSRSPAAVNCVDCAPLHHVKWNNDPEVAMSPPPAEPERFLESAVPTAEPLMATTPTTSAALPLTKPEPAKSPKADLFVKPSTASVSKIEPFKPCSNKLETITKPSLPAKIDIASKVETKNYSVKFDLGKAKSDNYDSSPDRKKRRLTRPRKV